MSLFTKERIILVTGASSGIGAACAAKCVAEGAAVIATGRDMDRLIKEQKACADHTRWHNEPLDLKNRISDIPAWITSLREKYGKLYGLLHCAGEGRLDSIFSFDLAEARDHMELNFLVPLQLARGFADRRNCLKGGSMVFIASISGVYPEKGHVLYGAAKAALISAVKSISQEVVGRGLRANCISPGQILTPMLESAFSSMGNTYLKREESRYPLGFGAPGHVADLACFLLSEKAAWITGENFRLSGGAY